MYATRGAGGAGAGGAPDPFELSAQTSSGTNQSSIIEQIVQTIGSEGFERIMRKIGYGGKEADIYSTDYSKGETDPLIRVRGQKQLRLHKKAFDKSKKSFITKLIEDADTLKEARKYTNSYTETDTIPDPPPRPNIPVEEELEPDFDPILGGAPSASSAGTINPGSIAAILLQQGMSADEAIKISKLLIPNVHGPTL